MRNLEFGIMKEVFLTPLGWAGVAVSASGICRIVLPKQNRRVAERELNTEESGMRQEQKSSDSVAGLLNKCILLLQKYFSGGRVEFDLPLDIRYYTAFQQAVWRAALGIPYGETRSYGWVARRIKKPAAARAVGQAMGANPIPVIVP